MTHECPFCGAEAESLVCIDGQDCCVVCRDLVVQKLREGLEKDDGRPKRSSLLKLMTVGAVAFYTLAGSVTFTGGILGRTDAVWVNLVVFAICLFGVFFQLFGVFRGSRLALFPAVLMNLGLGLSTTIAFARLTFEFYQLAAKSGATMFVVMGLILFPVLTALGAVTVGSIAPIWAYDRKLRQYRRRMKESGGSVGRNDQ